MRILLVSGSLPPMPCGVGDYTDQLARALAKAGQEVAVLTSRAVGRPERENLLPYEVFAVIDNWSLRDVSPARKVMKSWRPETVHIQYPTQGYKSKTLPALVPLLAWQVGAVTVRTWHEPFGMRQSPLLLLHLIVPGPYVTVREDFHRLSWSPLSYVLRNRRHARIAGGSAIGRSELDARGKAKLRARYLGGQSKLVTFFGFIYPEKGVHQLFEIADPRRDALVIAGGVFANSEFEKSLRAAANSHRWNGKVTWTGYLPSADVADLLAASDAVLLPYTHGAGDWNSSLNAALLQGVPVVTTSTSRTTRSDGEGLVYRAAPNDIDALREALDDALVFCNTPPAQAPASDGWARIAYQHGALYAVALNDRKRKSP